MKRFLRFELWYTAVVFPMTIAGVMAFLCSTDMVQAQVSAASSATVAEPIISRFVASPASITPGDKARLTGVFKNGRGVITPGKLAASSGKAVIAAPTVTTTYTLTVTNSKGVKLTRRTKVTVTTVETHASDPGVNIGWVNDWDPTQLFADAMKQARKFGSTETPYDESASVDAMGWPTEDAGVAVIVTHQGAWSVGSYALRFTGHANVSSWADENVSVGPVTYDGATNTSTATVKVGPGYQNVFLLFTHTKRTPSSSPGSGVTNVSLEHLS